MLRCAPLGRAAAPHPDPLGAAGSPLPGRRLLRLLLLGLLLDGAAAAASDLGMGKCGIPKEVANARIVYENNHGNKLRYACLKNFKRKAGTSSLIVCEQDAITREYRWSPPQLVCIDLTVEGTAEGHTTREIQCTNPASVSARLYGSQTTSPVVETTSFAHTPRRTAKPSPKSLGPTVTATPGVGWLTTGTVSESVTPSPTRTPFPPDRNNKTQWTPQQATCVPSEDPLGNITDPTDTGVLQSITGSPYFRIGLPLSAIILSAGFMYYCYCRRSRDPWRQPRVPSVEGIPMDPLGCEEGRSASAGNSPDPGPVNEEDPMLTGLPPPVE